MVHTMVVGSKLYAGSVTLTHSLRLLQIPVSSNQRRPLDFHISTPNYRLSNVHGLMQALTLGFNSVVVSSEKWP